VQRDRGGQLGLREVRVGHDRQHRAFLAASAAAAALVVRLSPQGDAEAEGADVELFGGVWWRGVVVGDCPGFVDGFLVGGELSGES
jgi:hypothetical protein